jgi:hypothetical protein
MNERWRHSERFRRYRGMRYPRQVAQAYDGDLERAMADSDEQVAAVVAAWEKQQKLPVRDWRAIGAHTVPTPVPTPPMENP